MIGFNIFNIMQNKKYNRFVNGFQSQSDGSSGLPSPVLGGFLGGSLLFPFFFLSLSSSSFLMSFFETKISTISLLLFFDLTQAIGLVGGSGPPH